MVRVKWLMMQCLNCSTLCFNKEPSVSTGQLVGAKEETSLAAATVEEAAAGIDFSCDATFLAEAEAFFWVCLLPLDM